MGFGRLHCTLSEESRQGTPGLLIFVGNFSDVKKNGLLAGPIPSDASKIRAMTLPVTPEHVLAALKM
jgi:hypothetical protein